MAAYVLFDNLDVTDPDGLNRYRSQILPLVKKYGGRYLAVGGETETIEGEFPLVYPVLVEFPDLETARTWYRSEEYFQLRELRKRSTVARAVMFEGDRNDALVTERG